MLKLYGFPLSNYHNKAKLALLEKGLQFEEVIVGWKCDAARLAASPLGKVPYLETEHGFVCESQAICEYLEDAYPTPALVPADPWQAAKVRELTIFLDLHVELCARQLYPQAFFGGTLSEKYVARVGEDLKKNLAAFAKLAKFSPYVAGDTFTLADCAAFCHLPLAGLASKLVLGTDLVTEAGVDWKGYVKLIEQRPTAQKVTADRKADMARGSPAEQARGS